MTRVPTHTPELMSNAELLVRAAEVESLLDQLAAARRSMLAAAERAEDVRERIADERVEATSPDRLATVICDGHRKLQRVVLDTVRYNRATDEQLCAAVLVALATARGKADNVAANHWRGHEETPGAARRSTVEDTDASGHDAVRQVDELAGRLTAARITATSPRNVARAVYNGHGVALSLQLRPGAKRQHTPGSLSDLITASLQAADRAVDALRQHAYDDVRLGGDTIGNWRRHPDDPGAAVASTFGTHG